MVETITSAGTMRGLHSVDNAMLVGPIIHQFLKSAMDAQGVSVRDTGRNYEKEAEEKEMQRVQLLTAKYLSENPDDGMDEGKKILSEMAEAGEPEEEVTPEEKPMGLMAKG